MSLGPRSQIFISYRRSDARDVAGRLHTHLTSAFGDERVFLDVESIEPGGEFPSRLREKLGRARAVLVVMGPHWVQASNEWGERRIDDPADWVRQEVASALADAEIVVIPILVDDAKMPPREKLPESLRALTGRQCMVLRHDTFRLQVDSLVADLADLRIPRRAARTSEGATAFSEDRDLRSPVTTEAGRDELNRIVADLQRLAARLGSQRDPSSDPPSPSPRADGQGVSSPRTSGDAATIEVAAQAPRPGRLSWLQRLLAINPSDSLRRAMCDLFRSRDDRSLGAPDAIFKPLDSWASVDLDFLIAGHTGFPRSIPRAEGHYFNAGGWAARLTEPPVAVLDDAPVFSRLLDILRSGRSIDALESALVLDPFGPPRAVMFTQPCVVSISERGAEVHAELRLVGSDGTTEAISRTIVPLRIDTPAEAAPWRTRARALDDVHVVCDLYLGGAPGFQVLRDTSRLVALIEGFAQDPTRRGVLVLGGNTFDLRTARPVAYLDPAGAVSKLQQIIEQPRFSPVFRALRAYLKAPNKGLALVLGDREVELALPHVSDWLLDYLAEGSHEVRSRVTTAFFGTGFRCTVGGRSVHCVHGHEVDPWNVVDHDQLSRVVRALEKGSVAPDWEPSAGTALLVDCLEPLLDRYPFLALLRPAQAELVGLALVLEPKLVTRLSQMMRKLSRDRPAGALPPKGFL